MLPSTDEKPKTDFFYTNSEWEAKNLEDTASENEFLCIS